MTRDAGGWHICAGRAVDSNILLPVHLAPRGDLCDAMWFFFHTGAEAEKQGFRACRRCRPNEVAGPIALVERASQELAKAGKRKAFDLRD